MLNMCRTYVWRMWIYCNLKDFRWLVLLSRSWVHRSIDRVWRIVLECNDKLESRKSDRAHHSRVPGGRCNACVAYCTLLRYASRCMGARKCGNIASTSATTNPFSRITFFPFSGRWTLFGKLLAGICVIHEAQARLGTRPVALDAFILFSCFFSLFLRQLRLEYRFEIVKLRIAPSRAARCFTSELSIDRDGAGRARDR